MDQGPSYKTESQHPRLVWVGRDYLQPPCTQQVISHSLSAVVLCSPHYTEAKQGLIIYFMTQ